MPVVQQEKINYRLIAIVVICASVLFGICRMLSVFLVEQASGAVVINPGIAFSLPLPETLVMWLTAAFSFLALLASLYHAAKSRIFFATGFWFVAVGAVSNFADRLRYGGVIDYVHLPYLPIFNLADSLICIGVSILVLMYLRNAHTYDRTAQNSNHSGH